jgi:hypothetical protein
MAQRMSTSRAVRPAVLVALLVMMLFEFFRVDERLELKLEL